MPPRLLSILSLLSFLSAAGQSHPAAQTSPSSPSHPATQSHPAAQTSPSSPSHPAEYTILSVPGIADYTHIDTAGTSVLPSGRFCTPAGRTITVTHDPFGMAISPDGTTTVTLHD